MMKIHLKELFGALKKSLPVFIAIGFSFWALYLRFERLAGRELWNDELYQLFRTKGTLKHLWLRHDYGDFSSFPGDYLLTYPFIQIFGESANKWGLAIPHILATILGLYLFYLLCRRYFQTFVGYLIAFSIFCLNYELIFHSFEFRPYAVLPALSLAVFYFTGSLIEHWEKISVSRKYLWGAFFIAAIWFHQFGILMLFFSALYHILVRVKGRYSILFVKQIVQYFAVIFILAFPLWFWYSLGSSDAKTMSRPTFEFIPNPALSPIGFFKAIFGNLIGRRELYGFLLGLPLAFLIRGQEKLRQAGFFILLIILPIELIFLADVMKPYNFLQRQFIWVTPLFAFLLGWVWDSLVFKIEQVAGAKNRKA